MPEQLDLFPEPAPPGGAIASARGGAVRGTVEDLGGRFSALAALAAALPPQVRFGTSSWSFPGWHGLVYSRRAAASALARDGLADYVRHPLFTTVGIDRSYYGPIPESDLAHYASQLPDGFPCCLKAPAAVTSAVRPSNPPGTGANPAFLSVERLVGELLEPVARIFASHAGPFILQFPPVPAARRLGPAQFVERLDRFLGALPRQFRYAVEIRQRDLLTSDYAATLARHQVAHVYNFWTAMPLPGTQAGLVAPEVQPVVVVRLLLGPGATYGERRESFAPFDRIRAANEAMREQVIDILARAVSRRLPAFVLVNNKAEGSAPLTIEALASMLASRLQGAG